MKRPTTNSIAIELNAVLVALTANEPQVLTLEDGALLPSGPLESEHPTLQSGLRAWVEQQTHHPLGYVEQLYTFADRSRADTNSGQRVISISYLGLTRERLTQLDGFFVRHGAKTVFIARFVTGLRVFGAMLAGASGLPAAASDCAISFS